MAGKKILCALILLVAALPVAAEEVMLPQPAPGQVYSDFIEGPDWDGMSIYTINEYPSYETILDVLDGGVTYLLKVTVPFYRDPHDQFLMDWNAAIVNYDGQCLPDDDACETWVELQCSLHRPYDQTTSASVAYYSARPSTTGDCKATCKYENVNHQTRTIEVEADCWPLDPPYHQMETECQAQPIPDFCPVCTANPMSCACQGCVGPDNLDDPHCPSGC